MEKDGKIKPLGDKDRQQKLETLAYDRLNKNLKSGLVNIRDAKRGIERLEDQVTTTPKATDDAGGPRHTSSDSFHYITIAVPKLWSWDRTKWSKVRLTWIGLILALFLTWFLAETVTCEYICHPLYSDRNEWSPTDPFWGDALPTLVQRCMRKLFNFLFKIFMPQSPGNMGHYAYAPPVAESFDDDEIL